MAPRIASDKDREWRRAGALRGEIWVAEDFDDTPEEVISDFEGPTFGQVPTRSRYAS